MTTEELQARCIRLAAFDDRRREWEAVGENKKLLKRIHDLERQNEKLRLALAYAEEYDE